MCKQLRNLIKFIHIYSNVAQFYIIAFLRKNYLIT